MVGPFCIPIKGPYSYYFFKTTFWLWGCVFMTSMCWKFSPGPCTLGGCYYMCASVIFLCGSGWSRAHSPSTQSHQPLNHEDYIWWPFHIFVCVCQRWTLDVPQEHFDFFFFWDIVSLGLALLSSFLLLLVLGLQTHACHHAQLFKWVLGTQCRSLCSHRKVPYRLSYFSSSCLFFKNQRCITVPWQTQLYECAPSSFNSWQRHIWEVSITNLCNSLWMFHVFAKSNSYKGENQVKI